MKNPKIAIIGLGYVGLPLAVAFAEKYPVIGLDINTNRVDELQKGIDATLEVENDHLKSVLVSHSLKLDEKGAKGLFCTTAITDISDCNVFIVTVPTPTDKHNRPVLTPMIKASETVAKVMKKGDVVIYESTVYPGVTEEEMVPILEELSGLKFNQDFFVGYSPERINPGDKEHTVTKILKVTSGSTPESAKFIDDLYKEVIVAGTHLAPNMRIAEASKAIENAQRDVNISFVNELALIFDRLGVDTNDVLEAAGTKWNFLKYKPGLVGGHCIGVDPYYLAQKAQEHGYHPEIILAGRRLNDSMGDYVASQVVKTMIKKGISIHGAEVLILGITFKENCPDIRNTKVIDMIRSFQDYGLNVSVYDPWADPVEVFDAYAIHSTSKLPNTQYDAIVHAVAHTDFLQIDINTLKKSTAIIYDVKSVLPITVDGRL